MRTDWQNCSELATQCICLLNRHTTKRSHRRLPDRLPRTDLSGSLSMGWDGTFPVDLPNHHLADGQH
jgi:hypothetical protein